MAEAPGPPSWAAAGAFCGARLHAPPECCVRLRDPQLTIASGAYRREIHWWSPPSSRDVIADDSDPLGASAEAYLARGLAGRLRGAAAAEAGACAGLAAAGAAADDSKCRAEEEEAAARRVAAVFRRARARLLASAADGLEAVYGRGAPASAI